MSFCYIASHHTFSGREGVEIKYFTCRGIEIEKVKKYLNNFGKFPWQPKDSNMNNAQECLKIHTHKPDGILAIHSFKVNE